MLVDRDLEQHCNAESEEKYIYYFKDYFNVFFKHSH